MATESTLPSTIQNQSQPAPMALATGEVAARMHADMHQLPRPKEGETPLAFVTRLKQSRGVENMPTPVSVEGVIANVQKENQAMTVTTPKIENSPQIIQAPKEPAPSFGFETKLPVAEAPPQVEPQEEIPADVASLQQSYKNLLKSHKEVKKTAAELAKTKEELERRTKDYETGAVVPELIQKQTNEIQRLSAYEKLFNFKGSSAYKEQIAQPLTQTREDLKKYFLEYGIPETVIEKAEGFTSRADRNRFLSDHFDLIGASEVGQLLDKASSLRT